VIRGATEVAHPVLFAVLTTVACVLPIFFLPSMVGRMALSIPYIVTIVLGLSLLEAFFVLPGHLAGGPGSGRRAASGGLGRIQAASTRGLDRFVERILLPVLQSCLRGRYLLLAAALGACLLTRGVVVGQWIAFAQSSLALPDDAQGRAWRKAVPHIIGLQAVTMALADADRLDADEQALALDRSRILLDRHRTGLYQLFDDAELHPRLRELLADASEAIDALAQRREQAGD